jgi:hypothetical protein
MNQVHDGRDGVKYARGLYCHYLECRVYAGEDSGMIFEYLLIQNVNINGDGMTLNLISKL